MGKDGGWKRYFHDNRRCADLINGIGCNGEQIVKEVDLQDVDPTSSKRSRDALRKVALGMNFLIIGIENQEEMDYELVLRNMLYDAYDYEKQLAKIQKEVRKEKGLEPGEYLYGFKKDSKLNPIATFILYAGKIPWQGPHCLHDMLDFKDVPKTLQNMISDYKINVIDIREFEHTEVFQSDLKQVFDFIKCSDDKLKLLELVENDPYYKEMENDAFEVVARYTNSKELVCAKDYSVKGGKNDVCKAIQDLMEDSRVKGREEGREESVGLFVKTLREFHVSEEEIIQRIMKEFSVTEENAKGYL